MNIEEWKGDDDSRTCVDAVIIIVAVVVVVFVIVVFGVAVVADKMSTNVKRADLYMRCMRSSI